MKYNVGDIIGAKPGTNYSAGPWEITAISNDVYTLTDINTKRVHKREDTERFENQQDLELKETAKITVKFTNCKQL
jgi:hypothetical protein